MYMDHLQLTLKGFDRVEANSHSFSPHSRLCCLKKCNTCYLDVSKIGTVSSDHRIGHHFTNLQEMGDKISANCLCERLGF